MAPLPEVRGRLINWEYDHPFVHNAQGMRAKKTFTAELPEQFEKRVLFLGDSFTYGLGSGDDETFVHEVDQALRKVEVANSGCNAYGQREELAVLDTLGEVLKPDLTVLMFFWNDLEDNTRRSKPEFQVDDEGEVARVDLKPRVLERFDPLAEREPADLTKLRSGGSYAERMLSEGLKGLRYRLWGIKRRSIRNEEQKEQAWRVTSEYLRMIGLRCREIGTELIVASIPDHNKVDPDARIRGINPVNYEIEGRLAEICEEHGIPYLDLTPVMKKAFQTAETPLYYYADRHLTPAGNEEVAESAHGRDLVSARAVAAPAFPAS